MRTGHHQHVRWGRDNLTVSLVDQERSNFANFETYRALHAEVAGRELGRYVRSHCKWRGAPCPFLS
jgi:hypothetical protein